MRPKECVGFGFVYLVPKFNSDGNPTTHHGCQGEDTGDAKNRRQDKMRHIWVPKWIRLKLKIHIYDIGVFSQLTYGS